MCSGDGGGREETSWKTKEDLEMVCGRHEKDKQQRGESFRSSIVWETHSPSSPIKENKDIKKRERLGTKVLLEGKIKTMEESKKYCR